jgi:hypothetical protein
MGVDTDEVMADDEGTGKGGDMGAEDGKDDNADNVDKDAALAWEWVVGTGPITCGN